MGGVKNQTSTSNGTSSGTSTTTLSPQVQAAYTALLSQIGGSAAGTNANTNAAASGYGNLASTTNPAYTGAAASFNSASAPAYSTVQNYLSPYVNSQLQAQIALENQQNAQQQQGVIGNAIAQGGLGGNRVAIAQGQLAGQQALANNATNSGILNTAYQQALQGALSGQQNAIAAGTGQTNLGSAETGTTLNSLAGLLGAGNSQFSNLGTLAGSASGLSNMGATTSSSGTTTGSETVPNGNIFSQLLGAGTAIAGLFSGGGSVPRYAPGGVVTDQAADRQAGILGAENSSAQTIQALQQMMQAQQASDAQNAQPNWSNEQKQGAQNIRGWFSPQDAQAPGKLGGFGSSYARGGIIRGFDDGGDVGGGFDLGQMLSSIFGGSSAPVNDVTPDQSALLDKITANDNGDAPDTEPAQMPMAVNSGVINSATPRLAVDNAPVARGVVAQPSSPVPLAPLPASGNSALPASSGVMPLSSGPNAPMGPAPSGPTPLTIKTNNPGAITDGPWARRQPGYLTNDGDFAVFSSPAAGAAAQLALLGNYVDSGHNTISSIIDKWAPQATNSPGSTGDYIAYVANRTGLDPNQPIPPGKLQDVANAQTEWESGLKPGGFTAPANGVIGSDNGPSWQSTLASDAGFGRAPGPNPANGPQTADNGVGFNPSQQNSPTIGSVISNLMSGRGTGLSDPVRAALISAGLGMMGGTNSNALVNIGQGAQQGFKTYNDLITQNRENADTQADIAQRAALAQQANVEANAARYIYTPTPVGYIRRDVMNPTATPTVIPYNAMPQQPITPAQATPGAPGGGNGPNTSIGTNVADTDQDGFVVKAPPAQGFNGLLLNPTTAPLVTGQTEQLLKDARAGYTSGQQLNVSLAQMQDLADQLPANGLLAQGAGFNTREGLANTLNTALTTMGVKPAIAPDKVATAEDLRKLATQLQFAVADQVKSDPAAATIMQAGLASPSGENTAQGFRRIIGNLEAVTKRQGDYYNFMQDWANKHTGDTTGADAAFNQFNPPAKYVHYGLMQSAVVPKTQAEIDSAQPGTLFNVNGQLLVKK